MRKAPSYQMARPMTKLSLRKLTEHLPRQSFNDDPDDDSTADSTADSTDDPTDDPTDVSVCKRISGNVGRGRFARLMVFASFGSFHRRISPPKVNSTAE